MTFEDYKELMEEPPNGHNFGRKRQVYQEAGRYDWVTLETDGSVPSLKHYVETSVVARNRVVRYLVAEGWTPQEVMETLSIGRSTFYAAVQSYNEETPSAASSAS